MPPSEQGPILAVSPHLDDAVFACGHLIAACAGTLVVTAFAGIPADGKTLTEWDTASGFENARQAVTLRRQEDRAALQVLSAAPLWLDFYDSQYHATPSLAELTDAFESIVRTHDAATVLFPAGLFHSDHVLVHNAMLNVRKHHPGKNWLMYEEASYRRIPGLLQRRMADLLREDIEATPVVFGIDNHNDSRDDSRTARKRAAVACYASQLRALERTVNDGYADVFAPERYWRLDGISAGAQEA